MRRSASPRFLSRPEASPSAGASPGGRKRPALLPILAVVAVVVVVVIGLSQAGGSQPDSAARQPRFDLQASLAKLRGAPPDLAALHRQANRLLGGGKAALHARLDDLRGHPVVVNKWASWCSPCRAEFPVFQQVATARGKTVAFLGLDAQDKAPAANRFLTTRPLPYPSYEDPDQSLARSLKAPDVAPVTVFLDARGKTAFIHSGQYTSARQLNADIERYLG